ncbi:ribonuclease H-like domain-containing protein [candidate division KSB1 bacterium]|nr:ribonuclease H-like domain-containing protein [candidate division KSB1 bacterium]RQW07878.1 MAG: hypothetical protein EH222_06430 [candidate division KSB1 bacterium]
MESLREKLRALHPYESFTKRTAMALSDAEMARFELHRLTSPAAVFVREKRFPLDFVHGGARLAEFLDMTQHDMVLVHNGDFSAPFCCTDFVFFDAETTGLAGGSGTYLFLAGLGFFTSDSFVVRQLFLAEYKDEVVFLAEIMRFLLQFNGIISFNGKTYDVPLLQTRCVLNKLHAELANMAHVDLLYNARRLWKKSIGECDLGHIENRVLGFARKDDVPGSDVPKRFFQFQQTGDIELLHPVFKHNVIDILSMVAIAIQSCRQFNLATPAGAEADKVKLFRLFSAHGDEPKAAALVQDSIDPELLLEYASLQKKNANWPAAVNIWRSLMTARQFTESAYLELAKYYEHIVFDYSKALDVVERAEKRRRVLQELGRVTEAISLDDWAHRKARLRKKLKNSIEKAAGSCVY